MSNKNRLDVDDFPNLNVATCRFTLTDSWTPQGYSANPHYRSLNIQPLGKNKATGLVLKDQTNPHQVYHSISTSDQLNVSGKFARRA